jgi:hypothetical protein
MDMQIRTGWRVRVAALPRLGHYAGSIGIVLRVTPDRDVIVRIDTRAPQLMIVSRQTVSSFRPVDLTPVLLRDRALSDRILSGAAGDTDVREARSIRFHTAAQLTGAVSVPPARVPT